MPRGFLGSGRFEVGRLGSWRPRPPRPAPQGEAGGQAGRPGARRRTLATHPSLLLRSGGWRNAGAGRGPGAREGALDAAETARASADPEGVTRAVQARGVAWSRPLSSSRWPPRILHALGAPPLTPPSRPGRPQACPRTGRSPYRQGGGRNRSSGSARAAGRGGGSGRSSRLPR